MHKDYVFVEFQQKENIKNNNAILCLMCLLSIVWLLNEFVYGNVCTTYGFVRVCVCKRMEQLNLKILF